MPRQDRRGAANPGPEPSRRYSRTVSAQPFSPGRSGDGHRPAPDLRPEDVPAAPVSLRRIGRLFTPYRPRLTLLLALIFLAAGLGVLNPFLLRGILDTA